MNASTPLLEACLRAGARSRVVHGRETGDALRPAEGSLYLADLSALPKVLLHSGGAAARLAEAGLAVPELMRVAAAADGGFVACRAPRQFLVGIGCEATVPGAALRLDGIDFALGGGRGGDGVDDLLAEGCPTDLAQFDAGAFVPTLLFGIEVGLWRMPAAHGAHWRVIAAPADGEFLAATLLEAVHARHGGLAGFGDYFAMISN